MHPNLWRYRMKEGFYSIIPKENWPILIKFANVILEVQRADDLPRGVGFTILWVSNGM